jgi:signal transduction histidine kinase
MRERSRTAQDRLSSLLEFQSLLALVSRQIGPALELQPVLDIVLSAMRSVIDFKGGTICLVDEDGVYIAANDPPVSPEVAASRVPIGTGLAGRVVANGEPIYSPDVLLDRRVDQDLRSLGTNASMRSYLAVPLVCLGKVIGLMQVDSVETDAFDTDDLHVLEGLATQVAGAIESARRHEEVMELERLKSDFIARVSHELRTPLTIIAGFTTTLLAHGQDMGVPDQAVQMLERVSTANTRLEALIEELLTVTSFEAGMTDAHPSDVAVVDLLERVRAESLHPDQVTVDASDDLHLFVDPKLFNHALALLVDNALKYAGDATLVAGVDDEGIRYVEVSDRGPGIEPSDRERIFERFTRGDHTRPGMGLGLPIVRTLADALGANVTVGDNEGGGARFTLRFA